MGMVWVPLMAKRVPLLGVIGEIHKCEEEVPRLKIPLKNPCGPLSGCFAGDLWHFGKGPKDIRDLGTLHGHRHGWLVAMVSPYIFSIRLQGTHSTICRFCLSYLYERI